MKEPKVAIYIRLSLADEDTRRSKEESDSVQHQRLLIHEFLNRHPELKDAPRTEFVDDGFTGTNTNRPAFQNMMKKLRSGELNVLVTKDFSRAMRDYTEMGNYLECVFPFLGVRYISINDGYDSNDYKGTTGGLEVVMRSIIYAAYSKDLSVKTTSAKIQMMKQGKLSVATLHTAISFTRLSATSWRLIRNLLRWCEGFLIWRWQEKRPDRLRRF